MKKAIFLSHKNALRSDITGGVQLCSQEFYEVIKNISELNLEEYHVPYTKNILQRVRMKIGMENYSMYNVKKDKTSLIKYISENAVEVVFINMASLVRYAGPIKENFGKKVKIVLLSHGNHSGDFLHLITKPVKKQNAFRRFLNKLRLGSLISTEAMYRNKYLDAVITLSETERQIENWFGAKKSIFLPRRLYAEFLDHRPIKGRVGFMGRLDHPPNLQGISIFLDELQKVNNNVEIRIVGAPDEYGKQLQKKYPFINYLGELSDKALEAEVATWALLLNPVWWYSTGASTKLAKAISWGVPIITTTAGMRGYQWGKGELMVADTAKEMVKKTIDAVFDNGVIQHWINQSKTIANSGPSIEELSEIMRSGY